MEFSIDKDILYKALHKIQGIVDKKTSMPILSNVLIEASDDSISLIATDLDVGMKSTYTVSVIAPGKITVSAKKLYEIVKELPNNEVFIKSKDNDWIEIKCNKVKFNLVGLSPDEFPYFPVINNDLLNIDTSTLKNMIDKTIYAISYDETKYNLNGVLFKSELVDNNTNLIMVATDGHRLSIAKEVVNNVSSLQLSSGVILPKKGINEIRKILDDSDVNLQFGFIDNSAVFKKDNSYLVMRLVDGEYPDYKRVIPTANEKCIYINKDEFIHSVRRMAILSNEKFKGILLDISAQAITITSSNPDLGDATEVIDVQYVGEPLSVRFNAKYLLDVLSVVETNNIIIKIKDELSPSIIVPDSKDNFISVIMPMRL